MKYIILVLIVVQCFNLLELFCFALLNSISGGEILSVTYMINTERSDGAVENFNGRSLESSTKSYCRFQSHEKPFPKNLLFLMLKLARLLS